MSSANNWDVFSKFYEDLMNYHSNSQNSYDNVELDLSKLKPTLRQYQIDAVKFMLSRESGIVSGANNLSSLDGQTLVYPRGGILADEMGLGKTVEVLALILNNPCKESLSLKASSGDKAHHNISDSPIASCSHVNPIMTEEDESDGSSDPDCELSTISKSIVKRKLKSHHSMSKVKSCKYKKRKLNINNESWVLDSKTKKKKYKPGELKKHLTAWYELSLKKVQAAYRPDDAESSDNDPNLHCHCSGLYDYERIQCSSCSLWQHKTCVGLDSYTPKTYFCPDCWSKRPLLRSRATFIVSPSTIVHQWQEEIKKHINDPNIKVFHYFGAKGGHYVQPEELADQDIVISTYENLMTEILFVGSDKRVLRHTKKYPSVKSPLTSLSWYRLVLDEAQIVESVKTKASEMIQKCPSILKWAVTGTPIEKSFDDLFGLMVLLQVEPLNDKFYWQQILASTSDFIYAMSPIMWRNSKDRVFSQLGLPPLHIKDTLLRFSPVENYFYQRTFAECRTAFMSKISLIHDRNLCLKDVDRPLVNRILTPLLQIRQACTHPQVVGGKFKQFKRTITMEELLSEMVKQVKNDIDCHVRSLVSSLNGQAGLKILRGDLHDAITMYETVLNLPLNYPEGIIRIDSLQKIHSLHNLNFIHLTYCKFYKFCEEEDKCPPYEEDASDFETAYLFKYKKLVKKEKECLQKHVDMINKLSDSKGLLFCEWWISALSLKEIVPHELIDRIRSHVLEKHNSKFAIKNSYSHRVKSLDNLREFINAWVVSTENLRQQIYFAIENLDNIPPEVLSEEALNCHLGTHIPKRAKDKSLKCHLCFIKDNLELYEAKLFEVPRAEDVQERKPTSHFLKENKIVETASEDNKALSELADVELFTTKREGNWQPGQMEQILCELLSYIRQYLRIPELDILKLEPTIQNGVKFMSLCENLRKEFRSLRVLWTLLSDQVAAHDEVSMAKIRFQYPTNSEIMSKELYLKNKKPYVVHPSDVGARLSMLENDAAQAMSDLSKATGKLQYLMNLQKNDNSEKECPICQEGLNDKWSVLQCGHCCCYDCITKLMISNSSSYVKCGVCRKSTLKSDVALVDSLSSQQYDKEFPIKGSYSTKVCAVVVESLKIRANDPNDKILIFSTWEKMLNLIGEAFIQNGILFKTFGGNKTKSQKALEDFKNIPGVTALLMPLRKGCKGLNVVEASHVFFVEPILNPAEETQAVGRIHRIGQTKKTFVHRFIISNTIEEKMLSSLKNNNHSEKDQVTFHKLLALFEPFNIDDECENLTSDN